MQQIFTEQEMRPGEEITITGEDVRHLGQVLRMRPGERLRVSGSGNFLCEITELTREEARLLVLEEMPSTELSNRIYLFQAIPKGDRMETVIEKAVELGVYAIIPVETRYCVVKLDEKKKRARIRRYQSIAESAAKQSKRSRIPQVMDVMSFDTALAMAAECDLCLLPYENQEGMRGTGEALSRITPGTSVSILIGPEGGFAPEEIEAAAGKARILSLGRRILRTDTAAITAMSMVMLACETAMEEERDGSIF